jgi:ABC-type phosphate transport system permease subunit
MMVAVWFCSEIQAGLTLLMIMIVPITEAVMRDARTTEVVPMVEEEMVEYDLRAGSA